MEAQGAAPKPPKPPPSCPCVKTHTPKVMSFDNHHIRPKSWGGPDAASNMILVCPATHRNAHGVLDLMVRFKGNPPKDRLAAYPKFARDLAMRGYNEYLAANGGALPTTYTLDTTHSGPMVGVDEDIHVHDD